MAKFIEVTESCFGVKILLNVDKVVCIQQLDSGRAYIELFNNGESCYRFTCKESYTDIYNKFIECDCLLFGRML